MQFLKYSTLEMANKGKLPEINDYLYNNNDDNENELILSKNIHYPTGNKSANNKILVEFKEDFFEYFFEINQNQEENEKINFQKLQNIACNYWHISEENHNQYYITYNNIILPKNESIIHHYNYIKENKLTDRYELKNKNYYIMDINDKKQSENKFKESSKKEKIFNFSYFSEIELYECHAKIAELEKEFRTERGYLTEKIQKITYDNIRYKLKDLNSIIIENGENFKDLDAQETKEFLSGYASRAESHNIKKAEKIKEITIKAYNRQDIPLVLTMKDLWVLKAKQTLMLLFYFLLLFLHLSYSRSEKNDNQLSFNLYNYLRSIFVDNRMFKHLTFSEEMNMENGSQKMLKDRNDIFFYLNFFINNLLYIYVPSNYFRYDPSIKYNRIIMNDPYRLAQKYPENTRNLIEFKFISKFNFKYSNYYKFIQPIKTAYQNESTANSNCEYKKNNSDYSYFKNKLNYFALADLFTHNISFCNGVPKELEIPHFENTEPLKFRVNRSNLYESNSAIEQFSYFVTNTMQNASLQVNNNSNFANDMITKNYSDVDLSFAFNQEDTMIKGDIMENYSNQGYVMNLDYTKTSFELYNDISSTLMKNLIYLDNLRVVNIKNIIYFKKFDLYVKSDLFFELGALGVAKHQMEFIFIDFYNKVKSQFLIIFCLEIVCNIFNF